MPGLKFCNHQEECQLVLGAVEAKVKLPEGVGGEEGDYEQSLPCRREAA